MLTTKIKQKRIQERTKNKRLINDAKEETESIIPWFHSDDDGA
jgi:hypothetical protein